MATEEMEAIDGEFIFSEVDRSGRSASEISRYDCNGACFLAFLFSLSDASSSAEGGL